MLFVDYIATKHGMYEVLHSIVGGASDLYSASTARVKRAIAKLVERAVASGDIRLDLDPTDLLRALAGVAYIGLGTGGERAAKHLVDILIAGKPRPSKVSEMMDTSFFGSRRHAARLDRRAALQTLQPGDLVALRRNDLLQLRVLAQQVHHLSFQQGAR
jgi:hypothetical protein